MKFFLPLIMLLMLAGSVAVAQAQPVGVDLTLGLSSNNGESSTLRFGIDCAATDGIDGSLGEAEQPPFPPLDKFYAIWVGDAIGQNWGNGLSKDYRQGDVSSGSIVRVYQVKWQSGTGTTTVTVSWNLPTGVTGTLVDLFGGAVVNTSISGSGSLGANPALGALKMTITYNNPSVAPTVITGAASAIGGASATLNGKVNPIGQSTTFVFDYGTTTAYGSSTTSASAGSAGCLTDVSATASGLSPNTTYHFRITATNAAGSKQGLDNTFTTGSATAPTVTTTAASSVTSTGAQLNGTINPNGNTATYQFEYGLTTGYGSTTSSTSAGSGTSDVAASATLTSLTPNATYHYRLVGTNAGGTSNGSDLTFTTTAVVPTVTTTAPSNVTGTGAQINGTVNPNNAATTYQFEYGLTTSYGSTTASTSAGSGTSAVPVNAVLNSLSPTTTYHYRLNGTNSAGTSNGGDQTFTTGAVPPTVTTSAATSVTASGAQLNGTVNPNGSATDYQFEYGLTTGYGTTTALTSAGSGTSGVSVNATLSSLPPNTTYHYRLVGSNAGGGANGSDMTFTTSTVVPTVTTTAATLVTTTGAQMNGTVNPNNAATTYQFEYGLTTAYGSSTTSTSAGSGSSAVAVNASLSSLLPNTTYHYQLNGTNSAGTANGSDQTFTTGVAPPTVTTSAATNVTTSGAQLNGSINPNGTASTYQFEYGLTTSYGSTTTSTSAGSGSSDAVVNATLSSLPPNTTYHYRIVGTNSGGAANGADQTFTTGAVPPTVTTGSATSITATGAQLNGTVNPNNTSTTCQFEYGLTTGYGATTSSTSAGSGTSAASVNATLTSLNPNTTYHFRITATNTGGSVQGPDSTFTTNLAPPTVTTNAASSVTTTGAQLNGTVNPNNSATTYQFEYGLTVSYGSTTTSQSAGSGATGVSVNATLSSLPLNTTYHFRLVATSVAGTVNGADQTFTTGAVAPTVTTNAATSVTTSGAQLNGTINPNGTATSYQFEYGLSTSYGSTTTSASAGAGTSDVAVNASVTSLAPNTTYHFRVVGSNPGGGSNGADQTFTTGAVPPTVVTSAATGVAASTAQLNGTVNPNNAATTYQFEYGTTTSYGSTTPSQNAGAGSSAVTVNASLNSLTANLTYHFRIIATNTAGSVQGLDQTFTTTPNVPPTVTTLGVSDLTVNSARLTGTVNPNGAATNYYFEYGLTPSYGSVTPTQSAGAVLTDVSVNALLTGLPANTYYYYRLVATNSAGTSNGSMKTVKTYSGLGGLIANGGFEDTAWPWEFNTNGTGTFRVDSAGPASAHAAYVVITTPGSAVTLGQSGITLDAGSLYRLRCKAYSSTGHDVAFSIFKQISPFTPYGLTAYVFDLGTTWASYETYFTATGFVGTVTDARVEFSFAAFAAAGDRYYIDDVILEKVSAVAPTVATKAATGVTLNGAQVNGSVTPNGMATTYYFEYGTTTAYGTSTTSQNAGSGSAAVLVNASLTSLASATTYHYRLVAQNAGGTSQGADSTFITVALAPIAKTDSIKSITTTGALVYGTVTPNGVATTYSFEYGTTTAYGTSTSAQSAGSGSAPVAVSASLSGLTPNTLYHFRVVAASTGGTSQGRDSTFTTRGLAPAITITAVTNVKSEVAQLNGTVNPNGTATTYYFEYGTSTSYGTKSTIQNAGSGSSAVTVNAALTGLTKSTLYHYRLVAQSSGGTTTGDDATFSTTATGISTEPGIPTVYDLSQNYPNPFNPTTMIRFALPKATHVRLTLYSLLGQPLAELVDDRLDAGYHLVEVNATTLASGIYFYRLTAGEFVAVKRMAVVK